MERLKVNLCGIDIDNPIIPASGTFGFGYEFADIYDINKLGTFSFKGTTKDPRFGNPTPRAAECTAGIINSVGLQNPGVDKVIAEELPKLSKVFNKKVMANIGGFSVEEYAYVAERIAECEQVGWLEVNISCPNVHGGGMAMGADPKMAAAVTKAVRKVTDKPVIIKLSPNVTDIVEMAKAAEAGGSDALSLINTLTGMKIDINRQTFAVANKTGGLSGPAVKPVAVRMVYQVANAVKVPIIGMGGIATAEDALEFILAGATAVSIGTANFHNPRATLDVIEGIEKYMIQKGVNDINDLIGIVK